MSLPGQTKRFLDVPFSSQVPRLLGFLGLSGVCVYLNSLNFVRPPPSSPGLVAERTEAPPVYLNPIYNGIPGSVRGPDDVE